MHSFQQATFNVRTLCQIDKQAMLAETLYSRKLMHAVSPKHAYKTRAWCLTYKLNYVDRFTSLGSCISPDCTVRSTAHIIKTRAVFTKLHHSWSQLRTACTVLLRWQVIITIIITIIDSMTSVTNTDASLSYNRDLLESLIMKKRIKSRVGHLSASATLNLAWKTALFSANDGSAYATHVPTNATSGAGHILQWKYPLHNRKRPSNCRVTDSPTPIHTAYGPETTIVEHLKTSQFRCSNRPSLTAIQPNSPHSNESTSSVTVQSKLIKPPIYIKRSTTSSASPWIVSGAFGNRTSTSTTLHFLDAKCTPKDGMTLVSSSKNTCTFSSSLKMRTMSSAYSRSTRSSSQTI
ncbi:hypothetical protein T265_04387 [Opisthorchis viverrini]|uniref:Uncharacterized protein n=1 Tax=Opisthorchis viverrini TaxID=6198 RepID=A0A074ZZW1_OPIVI|nr:hypothetical protein T265_04387 [Opisthorchis viverrini]KER28845.1 hypothetical protein T265_04387 [Opisthorchis viverrini]